MELRKTMLDNTDWGSKAIDELIDHILCKYHDKHRAQLPELIALAQKVEQVHGDHASCPKGMANFLGEVQREMENHMQKEEIILFPMLRRGQREIAIGPISVMEVEHIQHEEALAKLADMTHHFTPPANACNSWQRLYAGLHEFHDDLMEHIHLENNILFAGKCLPSKPVAHAGCSCQGH